MYGQGCSSRYKHNYLMHCTNYSMTLKSGALRGILVHYLTSEILFYMLNFFLYKLGLYNVNSPGQNDYPVSHHYPTSWTHLHVLSKMKQTQV